MLIVAEIKLMSPAICSKLSICYHIWHKNMQREPIDINYYLGNPDKNILEGYFDLHKIYSERYGENTIVLIELGSFFEVYGVDNEEVTLGKVKEIADLLNLQLTRRNKSIKENSITNPLMAGFPTATFDRYIARLISEKKYTIVVIRQKGTPPNITRYLDQIISPGVNMEYCLDHADNFIASIIVEEHQGLYSVGYAALDVTTGKTYLFEGHSTKEDKSAALDQLFGLVRSHNLAELILTPGSKEINKEEILKYLELADFQNIHEREKRLSVNYQNELFKRAYVVKSFLSPIEFLDLERQPLTSEALAHLIEFIVEHDARVIENLKKPTIIEPEKYLYLGNNPLEQLSIVSPDPRERTLLSYLDHTSTAIGKRLFRDRLTNPITDKKEIETRYDLVEALLPKQSNIEQALRKIYDLERIVRRIRLGRLHPFEINFLYDSMLGAQTILELVKESAAELLPEFISQQNSLADTKRYIEETFDLDETAKVTTQTISTNIFAPEYQKELTELMKEKNILEEKLSLIRMKFVELLENATGKHEPEYVTLRKLDKERHHLIMTKARFSLIEQSLKETFLPIDGTVYALSEFQYKQQTNNVKISAEVIQEFSKELTDVEARIVQLVKSLFAEALEHMDKNFSDFVSECSKVLARIDVAVSTGKNATAYRLVRPEIVETTEEEQYISIKDLRHPLVEAREEGGIYIPNDIVLGSENLFSKQNKESVIATETVGDVRGMLLYGINSSGKSSLMKSLGIAVILAQAGMYVPATAMRFSLCHELFTRIVSRDNFAKGLSSFAVEMMELKNIFNRSTPKSLVLGDEISHGTETLSAIAIVTATIKRLVEQKAMFLFTTHLHQICSIRELQELHEVASVHMSVHYDKDEDKLIFDRTLQPGNGSTIYGLEFAQSLHMDEQFLRYAKDVRKSLAADYTDLELLTQKNKSKYSKELYLSTCAICQKNVDDTHHISPQEMADEDGNIGHIHKNHKFNLLPICKECHNDIHAQRIVVKGFLMTSKGLELSYEVRGEE